MLIKIFAGKGEGKTTLAHWIKRELSKHSIEVEIEEGENPDIYPQIDQRLELMSQELKCSVRSVNLKKESLYNYAKKAIDN